MMTAALKRLTTIYPVDVPCLHPYGCGARAGERCCVASLSRNRHTTHDDRVALARRVRSILRIHFVVRERPCNGEAHSNPYIDKCGICAPRWGVVEYLHPRPLE